LTPSQLAACRPTTILAEFRRIQQLPDSISVYLRRVSVIETLYRL